MKAASQLWEKFVYNFLPFCPVSFGFRERGDRGREGEQVDRQAGSCGRGHCVFKSNAYSKSNVRPSLGACVSTAAASGRRLFAVMYDVELLFSSTELSEDALTAAVNSLKADGVQGVTSDASVDPFALMKTISGIASNVMATFETETASAATEAKNVASPPAVTASRSH